MIRETAREMAEVMKAYADGKDIQARAKGTDKWVDNWPKGEVLFDFSKYEYRVKPSVKYRPFSDADECWSEVQTHDSLGWVKVIDKGYYCLITDITHDGVYMGEERVSYDNMLDKYLFVDGSMFGVEE